MTEKCRLKNIILEILFTHDLNCPAPLQIAEEIVAEVCKITGLDDLDAFKNEVKGDIARLILENNALKKSLENVRTNGAKE